MTEMVQRIARVAVVPGRERWGDLGLTMVMYLRLPQIAGEFHNQQLQEPSNHLFKFVAVVILDIFIYLYV